MSPCSGPGCGCKIARRIGTSEQQQAVSCLIRQGGKRFLQWTRKSHLPSFSLRPSCYGTNGRALRRRRESTESMLGRRWHHDVRVVQLHMHLHLPVRRRGRERLIIARSHDVERRREEGTSKGATPRSIPREFLPAPVLVSHPAASWRSLAGALSAFSL